MFFFIGLAVVFGSVLGGYLPYGSFSALIQPFELLIIFGAATGAYIIANPSAVLGKTLKHLGRVMKGAPFKKSEYLELLVLQYSIFRLAKAKGMLALEAHIEGPFESALFTAFPGFLKNTKAVEFVCDYLRLMTMGTDNPHEMETLIDEDIEAHLAEGHHVAHAITAMSDGMPAFGIVAAVLGVIVTMSSITEPPEVLGGLIAGALVGTFLGVLLAYGLIGPIGKSLENYANAEIKYLHCIKAGLLAHMSGYAPAVSVEFARKILETHERPTFGELEAAVQEAPQVS